MKKILIGVGFIALISWGCGKSFLTSLQNNPNSPTTGAATPQLVLPGTITQITDLIDNPGSPYQPVYVWMGYWNFQPGYSFNANVANYVMTSSSPQVWDNYYGILTNLNFLVQQTNGVAKNSNYYDIANILEAICFQNLVDLYNDIPYSQALQANKNFYPGYDNASGIYDSLTTKLDNAMADISANLSIATVVTPSTDDVMFGGNMQSWLTFANTVKLRMLIRESNVTAKQAYITAEIAKTASIGYLTSDALVNPGYSSAKPGPAYGGFGENSSGGLYFYATYMGANQAGIDFYTATKDVRLAYFYTADSITANNPRFSILNDFLPFNFQRYHGNYLGIQAANPDPSPYAGSSNIGAGIVQNSNQSAVMMSAAESYFLQAEATLYGWLPGGPAAAQTLYQDGITKSYEYLNVGGGTGAADAQAALYYGQNLPGVAFSTSASTASLVGLVLTQKWAALNGINDVESYDDWRRTYSSALNSGYPIVPVSISPSLPSTAPHMPFRWLYPTEEQTNNNAAWAAAGGATTNAFTDKIFWMN